MNRTLLYVGGALFAQALAAVGCAEGNEGKEPLLYPSADGGGDVSVEASGDAAGGSAGAKDGGAGGTAGDASVGGSSGQAGQGGQAGGAGEGGSAGAAGSGGTAGAGGQAGAAGTGGNAGSGGTGGAAGGGGQAGSGGTPTAWSHTIFIDTTKDFNPSDTFATSSSGYTGYITWDSLNIYVGMEGPDVGSGSATKWVLVYLGTGAAGTTSGQPYAGQQPTLPFQAKWHLRWKTGYANMEQYNGSAWVDAGWDLANDFKQTGNYVEMKIPRADINYPTSVSMIMCMLNEQSGGEWTYAGVPSTAFADGFNPGFTKYFQFDLGAPTEPKDYTPKP